MKTIHFIFLCFFALLLNFVVPIEPSNDMEQIGETETSKTNNGVDCYQYYWPGRGVTWKVSEENGKNGGCGSGKGGKGLDVKVFAKHRTWGTDWWKDRNGGAGRNAGRGGYVKPVREFGVGNGAGGVFVKETPGDVNEGGSGKEDSGGNFIEASSSVVKDSTEN